MEWRSFGKNLMQSELEDDETLPAAAFDLDFGMIHDCPGEPSHGGDATATVTGAGVLDLKLTYDEVARGTGLGFFYKAFSP